MKTNQAIVSSYEEYLDLCSALKLELHEQRLQEILKSNTPELMSQFPFGSCLIDYTGRQYLHMSCNAPGIISYGYSEIMQGPEKQVTRMLPQDQQLFRQHIFPDILAFLRNVPMHEYERYRFSFSYRFFRNDGSIANLLQHGTYLEPMPDGKPLLNMVVFSDITDYKTDSFMTLTIAYLTSRKGYIPVLKRHYPNHMQSAISERELEVLKLTLEGLSSKLIADKLYLSIHTVKNHKRNMMERTSSKNISELIHYAVKHKLIY